MPRALPSSVHDDDALEPNAALGGLEADGGAAKTVTNARSASYLLEMKRVFVAVFLAGVAAIAVGLTFGSRSAGHERLPTYGRGWIPQGVQEIDVRYGWHGAARRVTDPSQVERMITWFDALTESPTFGKGAWGFEGACAMVYREPVVFMFRSANGKVIAAASTGTGCTPMELMDRASGATTYLVNLGRAPLPLGALSGIKSN